MFTSPGDRAGRKRVSSSGNIVQVVNFETGAVATGTTIIPIDNSIPQITEGTEFMTLAITPISPNNKLIIDVVAYFGYTVSAFIIMALFQNSVANALAAIASYDETFSGATGQSVVLRHYMTAQTVSPITFRVRAGGHTAGTVTFNGAGGARLLGGVMASSITITEITV